MLHNSCLGKNDSIMNPPMNWKSFELLQAEVSIPSTLAASHHKFDMIIVPLFSFLKHLRLLSSNVTQNNLNERGKNSN